MEPSTHHYSGNPYQNRTFMASADTPIDQTLYIYPGDERDQQYRCNTFINYPHPWFNKTAIARNGHIYTGYRDRTKCYNCHLQMEGWRMSDNPFSRYLHLPHCKFAIENLGPGISQIGKQHNNTLPAKVLPHTTCISPSAKSAPTSPHMRSLTSRISTFFNWSTFRVQATKLQFAESGFFSLNTYDLVACWWCDVIVGNWSYSDIPDDRHMQSSPSCQYLIERKCRTSVHNSFPDSYYTHNIDRVITTNKARSQTEFENQHKAAIPEAMNLHGKHTPSTQPPYATSPEQHPLPPNQLQSRLQRGFENDTFQSMSDLDILVNHKHITNPQQISNQLPHASHTSKAAQLLPTLHNNLPSNISSNTNTAIGGIETETASRNSAPKGCTYDQTKKIDSGDNKCKLCNIRDISVVYLPCAHLISCPTCSTVGSRCIICKNMIAQIILIYR